MWKTLENFYKSKSIGNQAKVFLDFINYQPQDNDLVNFLTQITNHFKAKTAVGISIINPLQVVLHENLITEIFVGKIPPKFELLKDRLISSQPLTFDSIESYVDTKQQEMISSNISIKTKSALLSKSNSKNKPHTC